jgi:hypothetical protein
MDTLYPGRGWNIKRAPEKLGKVDSEDLQNRPLTCPKCSGKMKVISVIGDEDVIEKILKHLSLWEVNPPEVWGEAPAPIQSDRANKDRRIQHRPFHLPAPRI